MPPVAAEAGGRLRASVRGGGLVASSRLDVPEGDFGVGTGSSYAIEIAYGLGEKLALGLRWQQVFAVLDLEDPSVTDTALDLNALTAGARFAPLAGSLRWQPWLGAHLGWYRARGLVAQTLPGLPGVEGSARERSESRSGDTLGVNVAAGVDLRITESTSIDVELRYHYTAQLDFLTPLVGVTVRFDP